MITAMRRFNVNSEIEYDPEPVPAVAVYPDSDKIGITADEAANVMVRREANVDYWEGER